MTAKLRAYAHSLGITSPSACLKPAASSPSGNVMSNANSVIAMTNTPSDSARNRAAPTLSSCTRWWPLTPLTIRSHDQNCPDLETLIAKTSQVRQSDDLRGRRGGIVQLCRTHGSKSRPRPPGWVVEVGIGTGKPPVRVRAGTCHMIGPRRRPVSRDEARRLLTEGLFACTRCQPDSQLHPRLVVAAAAVCRRSPARRRQRRFLHGRDQLSALARPVRQAGVRQLEDGCPVLLHGRRGQLPRLRPDRAARHE